MEILTPNVVRAEAGCIAGNGQQLMSQSMTVLFDNFFNTLTDESLNQQQRAIINDCVAEIIKEEAE